MATLFEGEKRVLTIGLVIAAVIYVGLAFVWGNAMWIANKLQES